MSTRCYGSLKRSVQSAAKTRYLSEELQQREVSVSIYRVIDTPHCSNLVLIRKASRQKATCNQSQSMVDLIAVPRQLYAIDVICQTLGSSSDQFCDDLIKSIFFCVFWFKPCARDDACGSICQSRLLSTYRKLSQTVLLCIQLANKHMINVRQPCTAISGFGSHAVRSGSSKLEQTARSACTPATQLKESLHRCNLVATRSRPFRFVAPRTCCKNKQCQRHKSSIACCSQRPSLNERNESRSITRRTVGLVAAAVLTQARL